jgi:TMPIT-like protein
VQLFIFPGQQILQLAFQMFLLYYYVTLVSFFFFFVSLRGLPTAARVLRPDPFSRVHCTPQTKQNKKQKQALRENILKANGSNIRTWWVVHHYLSIAVSLVLLLWPPHSPSYNVSHSWISLPCFF